MTGSSPVSIDMSKIVRGCPCFKEADGEQLCLNQDRVVDIEFIPIDPNVLAQGSLDGDIACESNNTICFQLLQIDNEQKKIVCISRDQDIVIRNEFVNPIDLVDAVEMLSGKSHNDHVNICNECIYGILENLSSITNILDT